MITHCILPMTYHIHGIMPIHGLRCLLKDLIIIQLHNIPSVYDMRSYSPLYTIYAHIHPYGTPDYDLWSQSPPSMIYDHIYSCLWFAIIFIPVYDLRSYSPPMCLRPCGYIYSCLWSAIIFAHLWSAIIFIPVNDLRSYSPPMCLRPYGYIYSCLWSAIRYNPGHDLRSYSPVYDLRSYSPCYVFRDHMDHPLYIVHDISYHVKYTVLHNKSNYPNRICYRYSLDTSVWRGKHTFDRVIVR